MSNYLNNEAFPTAPLNPLFHPVVCMERSGMIYHGALAVLFIGY
jgi:hypothetical protein